MAYVSKDALVPQNGGRPPTAECVSRRNAAVEFARCVSRTGRLVVYGLVPPLSSFMPIPGGESPQTPERADNAAQILAASDLARRSVLSGSGLVPPADKLYPVRSSCPSVVPLSWISAAVGACAKIPTAQRGAVSQSVVMPLRLPTGFAPTGLTGVAPRWGDALLVGAAPAGGAPDGGNGSAAAGCDPGFIGWIKCNPLLSLAVGLGAFALIGRRGR